MASEVSTIQSLKAVDAWIDVINANINGGVRTAFKSSRLKFSGSNVDVARAGTSTSLPLQFPEPGLTTANTVIDFSQGAITASTENTHLAIQGPGFFLLATADTIETNTASAGFGGTKATLNAKFLFTRDGEFRTNQNGLLVNAAGCFLMVYGNTIIGGKQYVAYDTTTRFGANIGTPRCVFNDIDNPTGTVPPSAIRLSDFVKGFFSPLTDGAGNTLGFCEPVINVSLGQQSLQYSQYGSTIFDFGFKAETVLSASSHNPNIAIGYASSGFTVLTKSLEASNASMTQSVPELSLAQKLFSALTKVLQTKQTNVDGVLNLVR
jgi:flagellar hook protein FlgE